MIETRDRILETAVRIVRASGVDVLTVRSVAEAVGVTPMAIYKHFDDKAALVAAVVWNGFERWETYMARALRRRSPRAIVWEGLLQYREFALDEPRLFDVMFLMRREDVPHVHYSTTFNERPIFAAVVRAVAGLVIEGVLPGTPRDAMLALWATAHGLVTLNASGRFGPHRDAYRHVYEQVLSLTYPTLSPRKYGREIMRRGRP